MTCIVGWQTENKCIIAGDSAGVGGLDIADRMDPKVFTNGNFVIGYTSSFRMGQLLRYKLRVRPQYETEEDYQYLCTAFIDTVKKLFEEEGWEKVGGQFILGYNGVLYEIQGDFQVAMYNSGYTSVGCGSDYALGALAASLKLAPNMNTNERLILALEAAVKHSGGVRPPFVFGTSEANVRRIKEPKVRKQLVTKAVLINKKH